MEEFFDQRVLRGKATRIVLDNGEPDEIWRASSSAQP